MSVVLYIFLYGITGDLVSSCSNKISIFPEFSTPEFFFYFWISKKDFLCTDAFEDSYYLSNRVFGRYTGEYMDMIFGYFHFLYFTVSCFKYLFKQLFNGILQFFFKYQFAIFGCPHKMIFCVVNCMAESFYSHAVYYTKLLYKGNPFLPVLPHGVSRVGFS
jgi:hypothetical protein